MPMAVTRRHKSAERLPVERGVVGDGGVKGGAKSEFEV